MPAPVPRHVSPRLILGWVLVAAGALTVGHMLFTTAVAYNAVPVWDHWAMVSQLQSYYDGLYRLPMLWDQHNEHRVFTVRLILFADFLLFRGLGLLPIALNVLAPVGVGILLHRLAGRARPFGRGEGLAMGGAIAILLASTQQVAGFAEPFNLANMGLPCAVLATIVLTVERRTGWALLAGVTATGLLASGLLVWPLMLALVVRLKQGRRRIALVGAVGCALIILYLHGYTRPPGGDDPLEALRHPLHTALYLCVFLGNVMGKLAGPFGLGAAAFTGWMSLRLLRRPASLTAAQQSLVAFLAFFLGAALLTALGRSALLGQAFSARYTTGTLTFWAALFCLAWTLGPFGRVRWALAAAATVFLVGILARQEKMGAIVRREYETKDMAALAATIDIPDPELLPVLGPSVAIVFPYLRVLRDHRLANFATRRAHFLGETIGREVPLTPPDLCHGGIASAIPVGGGLRLEGWGVTADRPAVPDIIVIANDQGRIVGLAHPAIGQRAPERRQDGQPVRPLDWRGYAGADGTTVYAVLDGKPAGACLLGRLRTSAG